jgi:hypothetical protein
LKKYHLRKLVATNEESVKVYIKKEERTKLGIAIIMCFLSLSTHLFSFFTFIFIKFGYLYSAVLYLGIFSILVNALRHSINFFIFYSLNKKFKKIADSKLFRRDIQNSMTAKSEVDETRLRRFPTNDVEEGCHICRTHIGMNLQQNIEQLDEIRLEKSNETLTKNTIKIEDLSDILYCTRL